MDAGLTSLLEGLAGPDRVECARRVAASGPEALGQALSHAEYLQQPAARRTLSKAIADAGDASLGGVVFGALGDGDWRIFQVARDALLATGPSAVPAILGHLGREERAGGRLRCVFLCLRMAGAEAAGEFERLAESDPDPRVRAEAVMGLGRLGEASGCAAVAAALGDPEPPVRIAAAKAAGMLRCAGALDALVGALTGPASADDADLRAEAVRSLGRIGDLSGSDAAALGLGDDDPYIRFAAAVALRNLWTSGSETPLAGRVADPGEDEAVAAAAVETLAVSLGAGAAEHLRAAESDDRRAVRDAARHYLARGGSDD